MYYRTSPVGDSVASVLGLVANQCADTLAPNSAAR